MIYQLTTPPHGQRCSAPGDGTLAVVRVITPREHFEADGTDYSEVSAALDFCDHCWPRILDGYQRFGHKIVDTTGNLRLLAGEFPRWRIFHSDGGRLYASARVNGSQQGTTVYAWTVAGLRAEIEQAERPTVRTFAPA